MRTLVDPEVEEITNNIDFRDIYYKLLYKFIINLLIDKYLESHGVNLIYIIYNTIVRLLNSIFKQSIIKNN